MSRRFHFALQEPNQRAPCGRVHSRCCRCVRICTACHFANSSERWAARWRRRSQTDSSMTSPLRCNICKFFRQTRLVNRAQRSSTTWQLCLCRRQASLVKLVGAKIVSVQHSEHSYPQPTRGLETERARRMLQFIIFGSELRQETVPPCKESNDYVR